MHIVLCIFCMHETTVTYARMCRIQPKHTAYCNPTMQCSVVNEPEVESVSFWTSLMWLKI